MTPLLEIFRRILCLRLARRTRRAHHASKSCFRAQSVASLRPPNSCADGPRAPSKSPLADDPSPRRQLCLLRIRTRSKCAATSNLANPAKWTASFLGILTRPYQCQRKHARNSSKFASPLPSPFHRAFDPKRLTSAALEAVIQTAATRS